MDALSAHNRNLITINLLETFRLRKVDPENSRQGNADRQIAWYNTIILGTDRSEMPARIYLTWGRFGSPVGSMKARSSCSIWSLAMSTASGLELQRSFDRYYIRQYFRSIINTHPYVITMHISVYETLAHERRLTWTNRCFQACVQTPVPLNAFFQPTHPDNLQCSKGTQCGNWISTVLKLRQK